MDVVKTHKCCSKCGAEKPLAEFHRRETADDGRRADCKVCFSKRQALRYIAVKDDFNAKRRTPEQRNQTRIGFP